MSKNLITVRDARRSDANEIAKLHKRAFGGDSEAVLVGRLHDSVSPLVSLVAESDGNVCGHILFSPVTLDPPAELIMMGLAPMAVRPEQQRQGIGSRLVGEGLVRCRELGTDAVVVLGHTQYYPRFGFSPAIGAGISCKYDTDGDAFMLLELTHGCLQTVSGTVLYHDCFDEL